MDWCIPPRPVACARPAAAPSRSAPARRPGAPQPAGDGIVRVSRETKGRGGKAVTLVKGLELDAAALAKLAQQLKAACGSGGTVKDGVIEVQGEHRDRVIELLAGAGLHREAGRGLGRWTPNCCNCWSRARCPTASTRAGCWRTCRAIT